METPWRLMRRILIGAAAVVGGLTMLIAVEVVLLARREFLPTDPGYTIDLRIEPSNGVNGAALRLAVLGDSTVAGVGSPTPAESLPVLIAQRVADATGRPVDVIGYGRSGARTATVLSEQLPRLDGADAIVIVAGSNDATHVTPWPAFRDQTEQLLRKAAARAPVVVLASTPRFHRNQIIPEPLRTIIDRYSTILRGEQRAAVEAVPAARLADLAREASPRFAGVPEATSSDGFHPSPIGYGFWADAIAPAVVASLADG